MISAGVDLAIAVGVVLALTATYWVYTPAERL
jgi:hypothetical protein